MTAAASKPKKVAPVNECEKPVLTMYPPLLVCPKPSMRVLTRKEQAETVMRRNGPIVKIPVNICRIFAVNKAIEAENKMCVAILTVANTLEKEILTIFKISPNFQSP